MSLLGKSKIEIPKTNKQTNKFSESCGDYCLARVNHSCAWAATGFQANCVTLRGRCHCKYVIHANWIIAGGLMVALGSVSSLQTLAFHWQKPRVGSLATLLCLFSYWDLREKLFHKDTTALFVSFKEGVTLLFFLDVSFFWDIFKFVERFVFCS